MRRPHLADVLLGDLDSVDRDVLDAVNIDLVNIIIKYGIVNIMYSIVYYLYAAGEGGCVVGQDLLLLDHAAQVRVEEHRVVLPRRVDGLSGLQPPVVDAEREVGAVE